MGKNKTKLYKKAQWMKRHYWPHLTAPQALAEYDRLVLLQNNCCAICNRHRSQFKNNLSVDHCHATGKVRGLLCDNCNRGLGHFKDDPTTIANALKYIGNGSGPY